MHCIALAWRSSSFCGVSLTPLCPHPTTPHAHALRLVAKKALLPSRTRSTEPRVDAWALHAHSAPDAAMLAPSAVGTDVWCVLQAEATGTENAWVRGNASRPVALQSTVHVGPVGRPDPCAARGEGNGRFFAQRFGEHSG